MDDTENKYGFKFKRSLKPEERVRLEKLLNYSEADIEAIKKITSVYILWGLKPITEEELRRYWTIEGMDQQAKDSYLPECLIYYIKVVDGRVQFHKTATSLDIERYV